MLWLTLTATASAGMPMVSLSDAGRLRLSTISFFFGLVIISAWGIRRIWQSLRKEFPRLPELSFGTALRGVFLWGLAFVVVLTMISGARELMTPGAWIRNGLTYQLKSVETPMTPEQIAAEVARQVSLRMERTDRLKQLGTAVQAWMNDHDGRLPTSAEFATAFEDLQLTPGPIAAMYILTENRDSQPGNSSESMDSPLVIEPAVFGDNTQLAYFHSGTVGNWQGSAQ